MWNKIPAFRILLPFLAGIIVSLTYPLPGFFISILFWSILSINIIFLLYKNVKHAYFIEPVFGFFIQLFLFLAGVYIVWNKNPENKSQFYGNALQYAQVLQARVIAPPEAKDKTIKLIVQVDTYYQDTIAEACFGKSLLYIKKEGLHDSLFAYGDILLLRNNFKIPEDIRNPHEFDYRKYLENQGIYYTAYFQEGEFIRTGQTHISKFWSVIFSSRLYFENLLEKYIHNEDALGVSSALLLGVRSTISDDIVNAFAHTGTMHILSVSGLHVGILFFILDWLLKFVPYFNSLEARRKYYKAVFITSVIWFYACITGLSPSVSRSAVMFTFLIFGRLYDRQVNSFNILAASAIPLLIINPYMITQVGFQLSYLAIIGIISFQPKISKLYTPSTKIGIYIWSLMTVSIAAQLGTVPVTIYYFHQFPNYFLLSNILAIPVSFLVLLTGILFFALSFIQFINPVTGALLEYSLRTLNFIVVQIDKVPGAILHNLYITHIQTILLYVILLFLGAFIYAKNKNYLFYGLIVFCVFCITEGRQRFIYSNQNEIGVYDLQTSYCISNIQKRNAILYSPIILNDTCDAYKYHIHGDLLSKGIQHVLFVNLQDSISGYLNHNFVLADTVLFYCINGDQALPAEQMPDVNSVIISGNQFLDMKQIDHLFPNATFILSKMHSNKQVQFFEKYFEENQIKYCNLNDSGFLSIANM